MAFQIIMLILRIKIESSLQPTVFQFYLNYQLFFMSLKIFIDL